MCGIKLKYSHIKRSWENPFWVHKKHYCPKCNTLMKIIKVSKIVNSKSMEAKDFDFQSGETYMIGNVKFIWNEFRCPECGMQLTIEEMKNYENEVI